MEDLINLIRVFLCVHSFVLGMCDQNFRKLFLELKEHTGDVGKVTHFNGNHLPDQLWWAYFNVPVGIPRTDDGRTDGRLLWIPMGARIGRRTPCQVGFFSCPPPDFGSPHGESGG